MTFGNKLGIPPNRFGNKTTNSPITFGNKHGVKSQVSRTSTGYSDKPKQSDLEKGNHSEALRQTHRMQG